MDRSVKYLLIIITIAAALRVLLFVAIYPDETKFFRSDSGIYDRFAINIVNYRIFSRPLEGSRAPLYSYFLAFVYAIFGYKPFVAILFQILLDLISLLVSYKIGEALFSRAVGLISASFLAVDIGQILYSNQLLSETLFTLLLLLSVFTLWLFLKEERVEHGALAGLLLGMAAMCRAIALYFPVLLTVAFAARYRNALLVGVKRYLIVLLCFLVVIAPEIPYFVSAQGSNLLRVNVVYLRARTEGISLSDAREEIGREVATEAENQDLDSLQKAVLYQEKAVEEILRHPFHYAIVHSSGLVPLFAGSHVRQLTTGLFGIPPSATNFFIEFLTEGMGAGFEALLGFCREFSMLSRSQKLVVASALLEWGMLAAIYLLASYGLWLNLRERRLWSIALLGTVLVYFAFARGPQSNARFRVPMMPYIYLLGSYGLHRLFRLWKENATAD